MRSDTMKFKITSMIVLVLAVLILGVGCGKQSRMEEYMEIIGRASAIDSYMYEARSEGDAKNKAAIQTVWISGKKAKSEIVFNDNPEQSIIAILNLDKKEHFLYYKEIKSAIQLTSIGKMSDFELPFMTKEKLANLKEENIKSIEPDKIKDLDCNKIVIEEEQKDTYLKIHLWYDKSTGLLAKYEILRDDKVERSQTYQNLKVLKIEDDIFTLPEGTTIQKN